MTIGERIVVIGMSGSGKTTLARRLADCLQLAHMELDAFRWDANWTISPHFRRRVADFVEREPRWVSDGNASAIRDILWTAATTIVWLDYRYWLTFRRLAVRTFRRVVCAEPLWNDNRESLRNTLFSRDSILWWMLSMYHKHRERNLRLMDEPAYQHLTWLHFRAPDETNCWLQRIGCSGERNDRL